MGGSDNWVQASIGSNQQLGASAIGREQASTVSKRQIRASVIWELGTIGSKQQLEASDNWEQATVMSKRTLGASGN